MSELGVSKGQKAFIFTLLTVLGFAGNIASVPMFFGVDQLFGSIFVLLNAYLLGPVLGLASALVAHSYTIVLWNHPYAYVGFSLEALIVGILIRKNYRTIFLADSIYWVVIGMPLAWLCYAHFIKMPPTQALLIVLKQPANGLVNALVATLLITIFPFDRWVGNRTARLQISFRELMFIIIMSFVFFPLFFTAIANSRQVFKDTIEMAGSDLKNASFHLQREFSEWVTKRKEFILTAADDPELTKGNGFKIIYRLDSNRAAVNDIAAPTQKSKSARPAHCGKPGLSLMTARAGPRVALTVQSGAGCRVGVMDHGIFRDFLILQRFKAGFESTIIDGDGRILASTHKGYEAGGNYDELRKGEVASADEMPGYHWLPADSSMPLMLRWKKSYYVRRHVLDPENGLTLVQEAPYSGYIDQLQRFYIRIFSVMICLILFAIVMSIYVRRLLSNEIQALTDVTTDLPARLIEQRGIHWPRSFIEEIDFLTHNVQQMATVIGRTYQESEARYNKLFKTSKDAILVTDASGCIIDANKMAEVLTGIDAEKIIGARILDLHPPEDLKRYEGIYHDFRLEGKIAGQGDEYVVHRTHGKIPVEMNLIRMNLKNNEVVLVLFKDITERKQAGESLRKSEEKYRTLLENLPQKVFFKNRDSSYVSCNANYARDLGIEPDQIAGMTDYDFFPGDLARKYRRDDREIVEKGTTREIEERYIQDGKEVFVQTIKTPVQDENGEVIGLLGVFWDISERKEAEAEKAHLYQQLRTAQKMEAIGTLAGGIAHDFNNILGAIMGYTELALLEVGDKRPKSHLNQVIQASDRAKELVMQILTFSRQADQEIKPIQVKTIVEEALKLLRASLPTTIQIVQELKSDSVILGDSTQVHQVMMNLCTNAGHAMSKNGGVLSVALSDEVLDYDFAQAHPEITPGSHVRLTVKDTGHGMPPDVVERVFDPFFTTKDKAEGTGMGLAVVHGIVKSHGGAIYAHSISGKGAGFEVYLPAVNKEQIVMGPQEEPLPRGTESVLFVDDEKALLDIGKKGLELLGYTVTTKNKSTDALAHFRATPDAFDIVITDMTMPHMTGDELAKALIAIRPDIPIILCTGFSAKISEEKALAMGICAYVLKPVVVKRLAGTIRKVLEKKCD